MELNKFYCGDNLKILKDIEPESVDLIYLDPPFFTNRNFMVIKNDNEVNTFSDIFKSMEDYISFLKERVVEMHRILKPTGNFFLHCDYHANAYIRVFILDKIFKEKNFRNEIIWKRTSSNNCTKRKVSTIHDTIFYYAKNMNNTYNQEYLEICKNTRIKYNRDDGDGRGLYNLHPLYNRPRLTSLKRHKEYFKEYEAPPQGWSYNDKTLERLDADNRIFYHKKDDGSLDYNHLPQKKIYLNESKGKTLISIWDEFGCVQGFSTEYCHYPTQKPEKLLERIIKISTNEGDIVLDPFCGSGTTCVVANRMGRKWIGIDKNENAIKIAKDRIDEQPLNIFSH